MKKFYAFAAAALCAFAANAQNGAPLYATGAGPAFDPSWSPKAPAQFEYADGVYTLELDGLTQFKISTVSGADAPEESDGWAEFNGGALSYEGAPQTKLEEGVPMPLTNTVNENLVTPGSGDYVVTVAGDLSTVTVKAKGEIDTSFPDVFVRGDMNTWNAVDEWKMSVIVPEKVFSLAVPSTITKSMKFKMADKDWNDVNVGSDGEVILTDVETEVFNGGNPANMQLEEDFDGTIYLNLDLEGKAYVVFATDDDSKPEWADASGVSAIAADNNVVAKYYNLQGVQVANPENGLFIVVKGDKATKVLVK